MKITVEVWTGPSLEGVSADNKSQVWTHTPEAFSQGCLGQGAQLGFAARATAPHQQEQQGGLGQTGNKKALNAGFSLGVAGSETAQCSLPALKGWLSEELWMACSDQEIKLHFNLQDSFKIFRFSSKGASDTGAKPSHGGKKDLLHLQQTTPLNPARPKELRFPSRTLCTRCSS